MEQKLFNSLLEKLYVKQFQNMLTVNKLPRNKDYNSQRLWRTNYRVRGNSFHIC